MVAIGCSAGDQHSFAEDPDLLLIRRCRSLGLTNDASIMMRRRVASMFDRGLQVNESMVNILEEPNREARMRFLARKTAWMKRYSQVFESAHFRRGSLIFLTTDDFVVNLAFGHDTDLRGLAKAAVAHCGGALMHVSSKFQDDRAVVESAVRHTGAALQHASERLRGYLDIVKLAVQKDGHALGFASEACRDDKEAVLLAVRQCGRSLVHASVRLRDDPLVVTAAVRNDGLAIHYVSARLRNSGDLMMAAMGHSGTALLWHATASAVVHDEDDV